MPSILSKLLPPLATTFGIQTLCALIFVPQQNDKYYDFCGAIGNLSTTFVSLYYPTLQASFSAGKLLPLPPLSSFAPRQLLLTAALGVWAIRLGGFLAQRALKAGGDSRFDETKKQPRRFTFFWMAQATWTFLIGLPVYLSNIAPASVHPPLGPQDYAAFGLFAASFLFEIVADHQKSAWRRAKERKEHDEKFISSGLWGVSRHPNYIGELGIWTGIWALSTAGLQTRHFPRGTVVLAGLSPLFTYFVLSKLCKYYAADMLGYIARAMVAQVALVIMAIAMLILSLMSLVLEFEYNVVQIPSIGYNPPDPDWLTRVMANITIAGAFMHRLNFLASDGIVVWRAWVLFPRNLTVRIVLVLCMIGSTGELKIDVYLSARDGLTNLNLKVGILVDAGRGAARVLEDPAAQGDGQAPGAPVGGLVMSLPLFITNVIATLLIGHKARMHRQEMKKNLASCSNSVVKVQKVLLLLVESGVAYCILWIFYTASAFFNGAVKSTASFEIFGIAMPLLSGLYPIIVILIVTLESKRDLSQLNETSVSQSIKFAAAPCGPLAVSANSESLAAVSGSDARASA
ncbi:hypothetical protein D9758_010575 [Tetrapyrgos nigripes]|uniref:Steroid 5-alpha reductase C-terminal domain-containing protein n=1 Tax=Tetrapyrgos nigripes TaxID=182062 RepID=A0A8H5D6W7_9AGAR|nr:hypothetical protein D9758_010575 [Tetrapyrgos nigripes]